jgi:ATP-dependent Clp protease ATP-binding subunit ClpC
LLHKKILSLEIGSLIAGAKMQGEFEERLKAIKDEVIASAGEIILFIDEIHTVVGAGRSGGGLDASNMLKPALAKGLLQTIGATTLKEYKKYIESDKALERRFQPVKVKQPTVEQTVDILRGLQKKYENHHQIEYDDSALRAAAELSDRYLTDRFLPDKAIDLLDESGAVKRLQVVYTPPEIRTLDSQMHQLLGKKSRAFNEQDFEKMAGYQMELAEIEDKLSQARKDFSKTNKEVDRLVTENDVAELIGKSTGIPVAKMVQDDSTRLKNLEKELGLKVIGQKHAISSISHSIRRNRSGLRKPNGPIASFLFLGPTGVGKTELAKAIAKEVLNDDSRIIRIDMSEFSERHDVSKLIGSPPGYVGYGEGGQLTEKVKHQPYSVVLFDEFEKAHPDVYNILLQVLDEGWLTDGEGQQVSFRNCVIIGTSNIGAEIMVDRKRPMGLGGQEEDYDDTKESSAVLKEVRNFLRPEFINRLDEIIIFDRLGSEELGQILEIQILDLEARLTAMSIQLSISEEAKKFILTSIDTLNFGARPLKRKLETLIENEIASHIIDAAGSLKKVAVDVEKGSLKVLAL